MASCSACGVDITWAQDEQGVRIPLEKYTDQSGDRRFTVVDLGPPLVVKSVAPQAQVSAYPDHRVDCPAADNGL